MTTKTHDIGYDYKALTETLPSKGEWSDVSWINDTCNSVQSIVDGIGTYTVWFDYLKPADREFPETPMYSATLTLPDGDMVDVVDADNFDEIIEALNADFERRTQ